MLYFAKTGVSGVLRCLLPPRGAFVARSSLRLRPASVTRDRRDGMQEATPAKSLTAETRGNLRSGFNIALPFTMSNRSKRRDTVVSRATNGRHYSSFKGVPSSLLPKQEKSRSDEERWNKWKRFASLCKNSSVFIQLDALDS